MNDRTHNDSQDQWLREVVKHEENLINARITWMLTFQGFLFAAVSLATGDIRSDLLDTVPIIGMLIAALAVLGITAAYLTIDEARRNYGGLVFGGLRLRKWLGRTNSLGICVVVTLGWLWLYVRLH